MASLFPSNNNEDEQRIPLTDIPRRTYRAKLPHEYKGQLSERVTPKEYRKIPAIPITTRLSLSIQNVINKTLTGEEAYTPIETAHILGAHKQLGEERIIPSPEEEEKYVYMLSEHCLSQTEHTLPDGIDLLEEEDTFAYLQDTKTLLQEQLKNNLATLDPQTLLRTTNRFITAAMFYLDQDTFEEVFALTSKAHEALIQPKTFTQASPEFQEALRALDITYGYLHLLLGSKYIRSEDIHTYQTGAIFEAEGVAILENHLQDTTQTLPVTTPNHWQQLPGLSEIDDTKGIQETLWKLYAKYGQWEQTLTYLHTLAKGDTETLTYGYQTLVAMSIPTAVLLPHVQRLATYHPDNLQVIRTYTQTLLADPYYLQKNPDLWEDIVKRFHLATTDNTVLIEMYTALIDHNIPISILHPHLEKLVSQAPEHTPFLLLFAHAITSNPEYFREHPARQEVLTPIITQINLLASLPVGMTITPEGATQRITFAKFLYQQRRFELAGKLLQPILQQLHDPNIKDQYKLETLSVLGLCHQERHKYNSARNYFASAQAYTTDPKPLQHLIRSCGAAKYTHTIQELRLIKHILQTEPSPSAQQEFIHILTQSYPLTREEALYTPVLPPEIERAYVQLMDIFTERQEPHNRQAVEDALDNYNKFSSLPSRRTLQLPIQKMQEEQEAIKNAAPISIPLPKRS